MMRLLHVFLFILLLLSVENRKCSLCQVEAFSQSSIQICYNASPQRWKESNQQYPHWQTMSSSADPLSAKVSPENRRRIVTLRQSKRADRFRGDDEKELEFHFPTAFTLVAGQSAVILIATTLAWLARTPGFFGLGSGFTLGTAEAWQTGFLATVPLVILAAALDLIEDSVPALQRVTKATQRSVLTLLGARFLPWTALLTATALGIVAGVGEEWLFRGVFQTELAHRVFPDQGVFPAVFAASALFGALHAVTPLYAILASLASMYFGYLYVWTDNLAVPMLSHAIYDIGALFYAHWTVAKELTPQQRKDLLQVEI